MQYVYALSFCLACCEGEGPWTGNLPIVVETYDELWEVRCSNLQTEVIFFRDGKEIASRWMSPACDGSTLNQIGDEFVLEWDDYNSVRRVVKARTWKCFIIEPKILFQDEVPTPWWGMGRAMQNLKEPD